RYAEAEKAAGLPVSGEVLIPGLVDYHLYMKRRLLWDKVRQSVGLDAEFYEGASVLLYPPEWLNRAEELHRSLIANRTNRHAKTIGVDPGEGTAQTSWTVIDELGIIKQD